MRIIERIEIKHFRSFDWWVWQEKVEIYNLKDFNVFSGANDSWKSNVLRSLNLFFNNEVSPGVAFDFERDLSKELVFRSVQKASRKRGEWKSDVRQRDLWVKIRIHFTKHNEWVLPQEFWVEKMWDKNWLSNFRKNSFSKTEDQNKDRAREGQLTQFLNRIQFQYVPAIKDRGFFHYLFSELQSYLFDRQDKRFNEQSKKFNELLTSETQELFKDFRFSTGINAAFSIPESLIDFFRTLSVDTENNISLFDRGDGIQARFIPEILNEISKGSRKKIIWWFEEPENSYESKNIRKLRDDFLQKYCLEKQLFITTHSSEFLALKNEKVSIYRVYKTTSNTSQISLFDESNGEWEKTCDDLGIIHESRLLDEVQQKLSYQQARLDEAKLDADSRKAIESNLRMKMNDCLGKLNSVEKEISEIKKPNVFVEDEYPQVYKIAWLKLNNIQYENASLDKTFDENWPYSISGKNGFKPLGQFLDSPTVFEWKGKKVLWIFDFDSSYNEFNGLHKTRWETASGADATGLSRTRKDHKDFHALLLPVPPHRSSYANSMLKHESILELELYFSDDVLRSLSCLHDKIVAGWSEAVKVFNGDKSKFWEELSNIDVKEFNNFKPLFDRIDGLFWIK